MCANAWPIDQQTCQTEKFDELLVVEYVIDGDTVALANGDHVRLIGLDTPELGRDGMISEPFAEAATDYLSMLIREQPEVYAVYDRERSDSYQRRLAHLFLDNTSSIQAMILQQGLATPLTVPPNTGFLDCYRDAARQARDRLDGIWSLPQFQPIPAGSLAGTERGYRIITGTVSRVGDSRTSIWINLGRGVALRILKTDLDYFPDIEISGLRGNTVEASGMIYRRNNELRMRVRHAADIRIIHKREGTPPN